MAGEESFEPSIEVLQAFEFKRFRVKTILCSGAFSKVSVTDHRAVDPWSGHGMDQKLHCSLIDQRKG
jgi:hypothetical protein